MTRKSHLRIEIGCLLRRQLLRCWEGEGPRLHPKLLHQPVCGPIANGNRAKNDVWHAIGHEMMSHKD